MITRSSTLDLDASLRGQARVIAAAALVQTTTYVNRPTGRALYNADTFTHAGTELAFLVPYQGEFFRILPALMTKPAEEIRKDIRATSQLVS